MILTTEQRNYLYYLLAPIGDPAGPRPAKPTDSDGAEAMLASSILQMVKAEISATKQAAANEARDLLGVFMQTGGEITHVPPAVAHGLTTGQMLRGMTTPAGAADRARQAKREAARNNLDSELQAIEDLL
jgi:hypothetical protein